MKAIVYSKYGPPSEVLRQTQVEKPAPQAGEVLIRVHASSVNYSDWAMVRGKPFLIRLMTGGVRAPRHQILGKAY